MSQRPQPVTSKFRSYYTKNIYPVYVDANSSSAGSTSSLTSVLYHDSFKDKSDDSDWFESEKNEETVNRVCESQKPAPESYCKRIIARQPHYPGQRITLTKYEDKMIQSRVCSQSNFNNRTRSAPNKRIGKPSIIEKSVTQNSAINRNAVEQKKCIRKIANKSQNLSEISQNIKSAPDCVKGTKSEDSYSIDDFSSVSGISTKVSVDNVIDDEICPSIKDNLSISHAEAVGLESKSNNSRKIRTAWEAWYLKKEKQKRKKQETEMLKEKELKDKVDEEKSKRIETCHEKIKSWLIEKEKVQKRETKVAKRRSEAEKSLKEQKKEELMKKSSEKYVEWKLEKKKRGKEFAKQDSETKKQVEAEEMIKKAKAANAFKRWLEEHKDHQMPVPYSYGISDGKLTSYYDKTSNPPPSFFNPDPWKPVIDAKH